MYRRSNGREIERDNQLRHHFFSSSLSQMTYARTSFTVTVLSSGTTGSHGANVKDMLVASNFVLLLLRFTYGIVRSSASCSFARGIDASGETPCAPGSRYVLIKYLFFGCCC